MDGGSTHEAAAAALEASGPSAGLGGLGGWRANSRIAVWSLVLLGSMLLNATLLIAFIRKPGLRTISNRFVMNLIGSNLLTCTVLTGLLLSDGSQWASDLGLSALGEGAASLVTTSSVFSVLLIGIDQYLAVVDPLRYRTRIDKLKCALLILSVWLLAVLFGVLGGLAGLNRDGRALMSSLEQPEQLHQRHQRGRPIELEGQLRLVLHNSSALEFSSEVRICCGGNGTGPGVSAPSYGLLYALGYALLGYLAPFLGVCWIYVSIYAAARRNSERTRNGSRPALSSASLVDEAAVEDVRRLPKISSLSSIAESIETTPSQSIPADSNNNSNNGSNSSNSSNGSNEQGSATNNDERPVIFTLGCSTADVSQDGAQRNDARDNHSSRATAADLKARFMQSTSEPKLDSGQSNRFSEPSEQRRKSSHDLMYDAQLLLTQRQVESQQVHSEDEGPEQEDEDEDSSEDEEPEEHHREAEAQPLSQRPPSVPKSQTSSDQSSTRSMSVNFNLTDDHHHHHHHQQQHLENSRLARLGRASEDSTISKSDSVQSASVLSPPPIVTITPPGQRPQKSPKNSLSCITNIKHRISNGSLFKYREETRAARISSLVIIMGFISWTPYVVMLVLRNLRGYAFLPSIDDGAQSNSLFDTTALGFLILGTYLSPLLFGYRSKRVKRELRKFFCFKRELSYKNNRSLMAKKVLKRRHSNGNGFGHVDHHAESRYNIFNYVYGRNRWPKEKSQFVQVPETALAVETCRSSFSSGASTQISSTSTDEC